ncbi:MAG: protein phosphatase 2C domain-containing protein, partial [Polyangiales bacterium]
MSSGPFLTSCARTDVGMRRSSNEDAFVLVDLDAPTTAIACAGERIEIGGKRMLLALSDGMGGAAAGEIASSLALSTLVRELQRATTDRIDEALDAAVHVANARVLEAASAAERRGMGATLTAVVIADNTAWIAEVGDSRAYLLRGRQLHQLTRDQSYVQMLVDMGAMSEEDAKESSKRNVILQAVGTAPTLRVAL